MHQAGHCRGFPEAPRSTPRAGWPGYSPDLVNFSSKRSTGWPRAALTSGRHCPKLYKVTWRTGVTGSHEIILGSDAPLP